MKKKLAIISRKEYQHEWYENNKERMKKLFHRYYEENKEKMKKQQLEWAKRNKEKTAEYNRKWRKKKIEHFRKWNREYAKTKRRKNLKFRLDSNMSSMIWKTLKKEKNERHWEILVDYSLEELMNHLEQHFDDKMNWDNYGTYWVIDHLIPRRVFRYKTAENPEFKKCWALKNLQPLEKIANSRKGRKIAFSFSSKANIFPAYYTEAYA